MGPTAIVCVASTHRPDKSLLECSWCMVTSRIYGSRIRQTAAFKQASSNKRHSGVDR